MSAFAEQLHPTDREPSRNILYPRRRLLGVCAPQRRNLLPRLSYLHYHLERSFFDDTNSKAPCRGCHRGEWGALCRAVSAAGGAAL